MASAKPEPTNVIHEMINYLIKNNDYAGHSTGILSALNIASASYTPTPRVTLRLKITRALCNIMGNLHGGATATIFDTCTTFTIFLAREDGFWEWPGVSRTLDVVYLAAVKEGEEVEIEAEIVSIGKRLGMCKSALMLGHG